jgi:hypothetical protein
MVDGRRRFFGSRSFLGGVSSVDDPQQHYAKDEDT